jgi:hypothetical protein
VNEKMMRAARIVVAVSFASVVAWLMARELRSIDYEELGRVLGNITVPAFLGAIGITATSYLVLSAYDYLGVRHAGSHLAYPKVLATSFVSYAFNFNLGSTIGGGIGSGRARDLDRFSRRVLPLASWPRVPALARARDSARWKRSRTRCLERVARTTSLADRRGSEARKGRGLDPTRARPLRANSERFDL